MITNKKYDAIVVFGGGVNQNGELSNELKNRVELAIDLYRSNIANSIIMTGAYSYKADKIPIITEAKAMKAYALDKNVKANCIFTEEESKETVGNAYFTKIKLLIPHNWTKIIVIAGPNHSFKRLRYVLDKVWGKDYSYDIAPTIQNESQKNITRENKSLELVKSFLSEIKNGDHESVYRVLKAKFPSYSSSPEYTVEQLKKMLGEA
ncbi:MAG: YdcF family protein [Candidatus Saccharimonadales bacterium]|jgi:uncharacterized SAM-binding protein YcdF (DUF218 family)